MAIHQVRSKERCSKLWFLPELLVNLGPGKGRDKDMQGGEGMKSSFGNLCIKLLLNSVLSPQELVYIAQADLELT